MIGGLNVYLFVIIYSRSLRYFVDVDEKLFRQRWAVKSGDFCLQSADRARWPGDVFEVMFPGDSANHCLFTASCAAPLPGTTPSHPVSCHFLLVWISLGGCRCEDGALSFSQTKEGRWGSGQMTVLNWF